MNDLARIGQSAYLNDATIEPLDTWLDIAVVAKIDDEIIEIRRVRRIGSDPGNYDVHVTRGIWGTTPAAHE